MNINIVVLFNECTVCCFFLLAILVLIIKINYKMNDFCSVSACIAGKTTQQTEREIEWARERDKEREKK